MSDKLQTRIARKRSIWEKNQERRRKMTAKFLATGLLVTCTASRVFMPVVTYAQDIKYIADSGSSYVAYAAPENDPKYTKPEEPTVTEAVYTDKGIYPEYIDGNTSGEDFKIDKVPTDGDYNVEFNGKTYTLTISNVSDDYNDKGEMNMFDWSISDGLLVSEVWVKAGPGYLEYDYDPDNEGSGEDSDGGLYTPDGKQISHVSFNFNEYSDSDSTSGSDSHSGSDSTSGSDSHSGSDSTSGSDSHSGSDSTSGSDSHSGSDSTSGSDSHSGSDSTSGSDSYSGSDSTSGSDSYSGSDSTSSSDSQSSRERNHHDRAPVAKIVPQEAIPEAIPEAVPEVIPEIVPEPIPEAVPELVVPEEEVPLAAIDLPKTGGGVDPGAFTASGLSMIFTGMFLRLKNRKK